MTMEEMLAKARRKGLWFHAYYQDLWFSPSELEAFQAHGQFKWGSTNFELVDPAVQTEYLTKKIAAAERELAEWLKHLQAVAVVP